MANKNTITTEFLGLNLASPIVLLSGCVGFGDEYTRLEGFSNADIGGAVLKGTTLEPRLGNAPHRVYETPSGMLNSIGLQNPGAHEVVENILPSLEPLRLISLQMYRARPLMNILRSAGYLINQTYMQLN